MIDKNTPAFKCSRCGDVSFRKQGHQWLCKKHYRFSSMRTKAKSCGKSVPSWNELETMLYESSMKCPHCKEGMSLLFEESRKHVVTLQHNRDGSVQLLCKSCNSRHQHLDGDAFLKLDDDHYICHDCGRTLHKSEFHKTNRVSGVTSYCKKCNYERWKRWSSKNRDSINARQRSYYANREH